MSFKKRNFGPGTQEYYKLHRPNAPRLKLPAGQKLLKNIDEVKAQAPACKSNSLS